MANGLLSEVDYQIMQAANEISGNQVMRVLNENGAPRMTVCPHCLVDDFSHVEGCPLILQPETV